MPGIMLLDLGNWQYKDHFEPLKATVEHPVILEVEKYLSNVALDLHPFFARAKLSRPALNLWITQEVVMTNAFSQIVLYAASHIPNVHLRAVLCDVAFGEHGKVRRGLAKNSHPWLLHLLRESVGIDVMSVQPAQATRDFIKRLMSFLNDPLGAIAGIGVGNERLIVPEYTAVKRCFEQLYPDSQFKPFLDANLNEDVYHSKLCYEAASAMIEMGHSPEVFLRYSKESIDSRVRYFDDLVLELDSQNVELVRS